MLLHPISRLPMYKPAAYACAAVIGAYLALGPAWTQGTSQAAEGVEVDVRKLSADDRAASVIGSSVTNDAGHAVGAIDDVLVGIDGKERYAVLSIGGFLGLGTRHVVVPYASLRLMNDEAMLPGVTNATLGALPVFRFAPS